MKFRIAILAAMASAWLLSPAGAASPPGLPSGWSEGYVYANEARLHYYHAVPQPGKPVMIMVHGITDIGLSWTTLTQELQGTYDIYMLDSRGHGLSDPFSDRDSSEDLVEDVVAFMRVKNIDRPILVGHSMGAWTVMRLSAKHPEWPRSVIMLDPWIDAPPGVPGAGPVGPVSNPQAQPSERRVGSVIMIDTPEMLVTQNNDPYDELLAACRQQDPMWDAVDCQYWALSKKQYHGPYTANQAAAMGVTTTLEAAFSKITAPALILKADGPPQVRAANEKAASALKDGRLVHIEGSRHNLHHDKRARTVELINEFLTKQ